MNRVLRNRILYFIVWSSLLIGFGFVLSNYELNFQEMVLLAIIAVLPSRFVAHLWKDFFYGKRLMRRKEWESAATCFQHFLTQLKKMPSLKWLMFFSYGLYSFKVEAVARTYLAECFLHLKKTDEAESHIRQALQIDTQYSYAMLMSATLDLLREHEDDGRKHLEEAIAHGLPRMTFETFRQTVAEDYS